MSQNFISAHCRKNSNFVNDTDVVGALLYVDGSMIRDYQAIQKSWFIKGQQKVIQTYGSHEGIELLGTLDYETGEVYVENHKSYDAEVSMSFLGSVHIIDTVI